LKKDKKVIVDDKKNSILNKGISTTKGAIIIILVAGIAAGVILAYQNLWLPEEIQINKKEGFFLHLVSPKGGEELLIGKTYKIKWESRWLPKGSIKGVFIHLADPSNDYNIATAYNPSGEYTWKIPEDLRPGPHYQICIVAIMPEEILETLASPPDDCSELFAISDETADWQTYRNERHGFEIKYPNKWKIDENIVGAVFNWNGISFALSVNNYGDIGAWSGCKITSKEITVEDIKLYPIIYTFLEEKECPDSEEECNQLPLGNYHLIYSEFCVDRNNQYLGNYCLEGSGNFYYQFSFTCEGEEWKGREKMNKCSQLFDQILSTFRFLD